MKQFLLTAVFAAAGAISLNAQSSATYDDVSFVSANFTSDGKAYIVGLSNGKTTANIMDADLNVVKQINLQTVSKLTRSYEETSFVKSKGVGIQEYNVYDVMYNNASVTATDLDSMLQILPLWAEQEWGVRPTFYGFTDVKGNVSCYTTFNADFYYSNKYGQTYPQNYFSIVDGTVKQVHVTYSIIIDMSDINKAEWVVTPGSETERDRLYYAQWFDIYNWDEGQRSEGILSQTLLNDDDKWEYILPKFGQVIKEVGEPNMTLNEEGVVFSRTVYERPEYLGFSIYNEDGTEIASILGDLEYSYRDINIIGGNIYLVGSDEMDDANVLYKYDRTTTSVQEVLRTNGKSARISVNGRSITVDAADRSIDEAVVYDMSGRPMVSARGRNRITLNASQLPEGLYSVATRNNGKTNGAQKIIIK